MYEPEPTSKSSKREMFTMGQAIQGGSTSNRRSVLTGRGSLPPTVPREEFFTESTQPRRAPMRRGFETMKHRDLNNSYIEVDKNKFRAETPQAYGIRYRKNRTSSD